MILNQKMEGLKSNKYSFGKRLGSGSFAVVYEAINERDGRTVAIKAIPRKLLQSQPKVEELVGTEIRVLRAISERKNQNVVRFIDRFMTQKSVFIVMEYCNGGDIQNQLRSKKVFTEEKATEYLKQILNGFRGLHQVSAMHRDFKLANLLLHQGVCKIADLGLAKQLAKGSLTFTFCGTSLTMAPEVLEEKPYGIQADIWSLGVVYYQMLFGKYPYYDINAKSDLQMVNLIKNTNVNYSAVKISDNARDFIRRCLTINPKMRISWSQIYEHPLFKNKNTDAMKDFYKNRVKVNTGNTYIPIHKQGQNISDMEIQKVEKNEKQSPKDLALRDYQERYMRQLTNILFIYQYVTPHINSLMMIGANHDVTLFILSKKAYVEIARLSRFIEQRKNFMNFNPYFKQFTESPVYKEISDKIKADAEIIKIQVYSYLEGIINCSNEIKQQFDIEKVKNQNWKELVKEIIRSYEFQIGGQLEMIYEVTVKKDLLLVIEALNYYRDNFDNINVDKFDSKITKLDYKQAEKGINQRMAKMLEQN